MSGLPLEFHSDAEADLATIADRYEQLASGLGSEFIVGVAGSLLHIQHFPNLYPVLRESFRRAIVYRFPFGLIYIVAPTAIRVIAIYPLRSDPDDIARLITTRSK